MVELKPSHPPVGKKSNIPTYRDKGQASKPKNYRGKKPWNKPILELKNKTDFQGQCTDLEGYTFDLRKRASDKFSKKMKEMERYIGATYSDSCKLDIITETEAALPNPEMPTSTDLVTERSKTDWEMTYLEKKEFWWGHPPKPEEEGCLKIRNADDIQFHCGSNEWTTTIRVGVGRNPPGSQE